MEDRSDNDKSQARWYVEIHGVSQGPLRSEEIIKLITDGSIGPDTKIYDIVSNSWQAAHEAVPDLHESLEQAEQAAQTPNHNEEPSRQNYWNAPPRPRSLQIERPAQTKPTSSGIDYFALIGAKKKRSANPNAKRGSSKTDDAPYSENTPNLDGQASSDASSDESFFEIFTHPQTKRWVSAASLVLVVGGVYQVSQVMRERAREREPASLTPGNLENIPTEQLPKSVVKRPMRARAQSENEEVGLNAGGETNVRRRRNNSIGSRPDERSLAPSAMPSPGQIVGIGQPTPPPQTINPPDANNPPADNNYQSPELSSQLSPEIPVMAMPPGAVQPPTPEYSADNGTPYVAPILENYSSEMPNPPSEVILPESGPPPTDYP